MDPDVDVLVIGAGVGGLATAHELLHRGVPAGRILVIGRVMGGRLRTVTTASGDELETGAGRSPGRVRQADLEPGRRTAPTRRRGDRRAQVSALRRTGGSLSVELRTGGWPRVRITARTAVLAMSPTDVDGIDLPADADLSWRPHTRAISLFKGFLAYDTAWWDRLGLRQRCVITGDRLQKLYFDSDRRSIFFYCDTRNSHYWDRLRRRGEAPFRRELFRSIRAVAGGHLLDELSHPTELHSRFWSTGIVFPTDACPLPSTGVAALTENILLTSDSFTVLPGWIEGALIAAENAAAAALAGSPVGSAELVA